MRRLLKYFIFPVFVAMTFLDYGDRASSAESSAYDSGMALCVAAVFYDISEFEPEPCLPRQIVPSANAGVRSGARRIDSQQRHSFEFVKSGKVVNASARYFNQNTSVIIFSSLAEPAHRLIRMGKLII